MTNKFKYILFIFIAVALIVLTVAVFKPQGEQNGLNATDNVLTTTDNSNLIISFQLIIDVRDEATKNYLINFREGDSLEQVLNTFAENNNSFSYATQSADFGKFITAINGEIADTSKEYWNLKVNGSDSSVGISDFKPQNNDVIQFTLTPF